LRQRTAVCSHAIRAGQPPHWSRNRFKNIFAFNFSKMATTVFNRLSREKLDLCYEELSETDLETLEDEELSKFVAAINKRTQRYLGTVTTRDEKVVLKMRKNAESFIERLSDNKKFSDITDGLKKTWRIADPFSNKKKAKNDEELDKVNAAIYWFQKESPAEMFDLRSTSEESRMNDIRQALIKSNLNEHLYKPLPKYIYETAKMLNEHHCLADFTKWKKKLYVCDKRSICYVGFYLKEGNIEYYIDQHGNLFSKEIQLLQTIRKFYGYYDFESANGEEKYDVELLYDDKFKEMLLQSFKKFLKETAFEQFWKQYNKYGDAIKLLKKLKIFFHCFLELNQHCETLVKQKHAKPKDLFTFYFHNEKQLVIRIKSSDYEDTSNRLINNFDHFKLFLKSEFNDPTYYNTPYAKVVESVVLPFKQSDISFDPESYKKRISHLLKWNTEDKVNIYHCIAEKLISHLKSAVNKHMKLRMVELKFVVFWVAEKYKDDDDVIEHFEKNKGDIKKEYLRLINAVDSCEKSKKAQFSSNFAAVYYLSKHYNFIKNALQKCVHENEFKKDFPFVQELPDFIEGQEKECARIYLKMLPDALFEKQYCKGAAHHIKPDSPIKILKYEKYSIEGIKCILSRTGAAFIGNLYGATEPFGYGTLRTRMLSESSASADSELTLESSLAMSEWGSEVALDFEQYTPYEVPSLRPILVSA
jgi:hypothetical protein